MEFKLAKVSGVDDAIISLFVSKRNFGEEQCNQVRELVNRFSHANGYITDVLKEFDGPQLAEHLTKLCKYGLQLGYKRNHDTLLRFIDFTVETRGLHKAAMGDLDAHAPRMNNRIVRASSRLASFTSGEKSDYYKGKILTVGEVAQYYDELHNGISAEKLKVRDDRAVAGQVYKFNGFGYVREDHWNDQDVQRGTYMLSIPSDAIWKCNFIDLKHIYAMRHIFTHAHPELKDGMEQLADQIEKALPILGKGIRHEWVNGAWVHVDKVVFAEA